MIPVMSTAAGKFPVAFEAVPCIKLSIKIGRYPSTFPGPYFIAGCGQSTKYPLQNN